VYHGLSGRGGGALGLCQFRGKAPTEATLQGRRAPMRLAVCIYVCTMQNRSKVQGPEMQHVLRQQKPIPGVSSSSANMANVGRKYVFQLERTPLKSVGLRLRRT